MSDFNYTDNDTDEDDGYDMLGAALLQIILEGLAQGRTGGSGALICQVLPTRLDITWHGEPYTVRPQVRPYDTGNIAMRLVDDATDEQLVMVSVNLPDALPDEGCIFVKDYSENEGIEQALVDAGLLTLTGKSASAGYVTCNEARINWS